MESAKRPDSKRDTSGYSFLYPFYSLGYRKVITGSPEAALAANRQQADRLAARLVGKMAHFSQAYKERGFPVIHLDDPCGLLSSLAVGFWAGYETPSWMEKPRSHIRAGLWAAATSRHGEDIPSHMRRLGRLEIMQYRDHEQPTITEVELNQPESSNSIKLGRGPGDIITSYSQNKSYTDSYPANTQAMNFIGMVDEYLDKLDQNRLVVVRD